MRREIEHADWYRATKSNLSHSTNTDPFRRRLLLAEAERFEAAVRACELSWHAFDRWRRSWDERASDEMRRAFLQERSRIYRRRDYEKYPSFEAIDLAKEQEWRSQQRNEWEAQQLVWSERNEVRRQRAALRKGHATLTALRKHLRHEVRLSPEMASEPARTSPTS